MSSLGKIFVSASGGIPPISISLDAPASTGETFYSSPHTFEGLDTGSYRVFLQDAAGCISSQLVIMSASQYPTLSIAATDISCFGQQDGSLTGSVEGGVPPYEFRVNGPGGNVTSSILNLFSLQSGSYDVTIEDSVGCVVSQNFLINSPGSMSFSASADYSSADSSSIQFENLTGAENSTTFFINQYTAAYTQSNTIRQTPIATFSSSNSTIPSPPINNYPLSGGFFGAFMETTSSAANVTCSTDIHPVEVFNREWAYRESFCETGVVGANQYRILNFYRGPRVTETETEIPSGIGRFVAGIPQDGLDVKIYTGSAADVNYDPSNPTEDKLDIHFSTSGSLIFSSSYSYLTANDLVVVMENSPTNTRYVSKIAKRFVNFPKDGNDITSSLTVTGSLISGSNLNFATSDYFGNVGSTANTSSLILTMSKENDDPQTQTIDFQIFRKYIG